MELSHIRLIGFAVGVLIVGLQTVLIAKQWRKAHGVERRKVLECGLFCLITASWQFGNLADETALALNVAARQHLLQGDILHQTDSPVSDTAISVVSLARCLTAPRAEANGYRALGAGCVLDCGHGRHC